MRIFSIRNHGTKGNNVNIAESFQENYIFERRILKGFRPHLHTIKIASGVFLIILGVLIFMGSFAKMNVFLFTLAGDLEAWNECDPLEPRLLFGLILLIFSLVLTFFYLRGVFRMRSSADLSIQSFFLPLRLMFILFFAATAILTFTGTLDIPKIIALWLTFQGIIKRKGKLLRKSKNDTWFWYNI